MTAMVNLYQTQTGFKSLSQTVLEICTKNRLHDAQVYRKKNFCSRSRKLIEPTKMNVVEALVETELSCANYIKFSDS